MSDNFEPNFSEMTGETEPEKSLLAKLFSPIVLVFSALMAALGFIPRKPRIILIIVAVTFGLISTLVALQPQAKKRPIPETVVTVEVIRAELGNYPIVVDTNGTIQADIRGDLVSQIRGEIVKVSDNFKNGGAFSAGDVLIELDQRDYVAEVSQALSAVSQAQAGLKQETALAKQAKTDWQRLGNTGNPPSLVAREPQVAAARAQLDSAKARLATAELNLERTKIKAPYTGRVIQRNAVLGQYVGIGTRLAEIFATDGVEVRLPVSQDEYTQLGLDRLGSAQAPKFGVKLSTQLGANTYTWDAVVTRTDSTFDLNTRQIDVIAEVVDPFNLENSREGSNSPANRNRPPLKIGQFVSASIAGRVLEDVITVPNKSLREGSYVFTSQDKKLVRTPIELSWQDDKNAVVVSGVNPGDIVVTTSLNSTLAGASVKYRDSAFDGIDATASNTRVAPAASTKNAESAESADAITTEATSVDQSQSDASANKDSATLHEREQTPSETENVDADLTENQESTSSPNAASVSQQP